MNPFEQWQIRLSRITGELYHLAHPSVASRRVWQPAINAFRLTDRYVLCVDLAGLRKEDISVRVDGQWVRISGNRPSPEPAVAPGHPAAQVLALEIDYGPFERGIRIPERIAADRVTARYREGLLWIDIPVAGPEQLVQPTEVRP